MSEEPPHAEPTVLANRYRLERRLGQGGMSEVWLATDIALDRRVAVKWLKPTLATDEIVAERFRREAIAVARLNHPNIVAVHDAFEHDGRQAVVMQLVDGKSLRQLLDVQTRLSPELTIHIGSCVAAALDSAHRAGFVHRDVKPGNILVTADGRVMLTDFGIAKGLDSSEDDLTSDNVMMGTAKYLSPEQVRGKRLDGRADLYSLGLVLYECLAGRVPFLGETDADTALARLQRDPTDLGRLRPTLPRGLVSLIHQLLARNPNHRPATGAELRNSLAVVADEPPPQIDSTPAEPPPRFESAIRPVGGYRRRAGASGVGPRGGPAGSSGSGTSSGSGAHDDPAAAPGAGRQGRPAIPGEAARTPAAGARPQRRTPAASTGVAEQTPPPTPSPETPPERRDPTPRAQRPIRGRPARDLQQRYTPSLVVVLVLLVVAALVAVLLWFTLRTDDEDPATSTPRDSTSANAGDETGDADEPRQPTRPVEVASLTASGLEGPGMTDELADQASPDGDDATRWPTECYSDQYLGGRQGVGLVMNLNRAASGTLTFDVLSHPYQVDVYATSGDAPTSFDGWGEAIGHEVAQEPGTVSVDVTRARHVLITFVELGRDPACSGDNPYRGLLGDVAFSS